MKSTINSLNEKIRNISKKTMAIALAAALILSAAAGAGINALISSSERTSVITSQEVKAESAETAEKDETVYVIADSNGNPQKVIVSDWLKNNDSFKTIDDYSDLKNIENLKGYETFEAAGNNEQKWDAKGNGKEQTVQGSLTRVRQVLWKRFRCGCCGKIHIRQRARLLKRPSCANKI